MRRLLLAALLVAPSAATGQVVDTLALDTLTTASPRVDPDSAFAADTLEEPYGGPLPGSAAERLDRLTTAAPEAPGGVGIIAAGLAEAEIAVQHASLARRNAHSLAEMRRHVAHVLHAIDPDEVGRGPGMGFGVVRAARDVLALIEQVESLQGLPGVVRFHAPWVARSARGTLARADEAVDLARQVQRATSTPAARALVERLYETARAMTYGFDRDDDGRIGSSEDEMGLAQARYHLALVERLTR